MKPASETKYAVETAPPKSIPITNGSRLAIKHLRVLQACEDYFSYLFIYHYRAYCLMRAVLAAMCLVNLVVLFLLAKAFVVWMF